MSIETAMRLCWDGNLAPTLNAERDAIRYNVFQRDNGQCVFCKQPAVDAHHLLERRLWDDGGYHLDNLIAVCYTCHYTCEQTRLSVEEGREAAGITNIVVPDHLYVDQSYDKWGNPILSNGQRLRGELFDVPSVQILLREANLLNLFTPYVKYPRTYHLPWSNPNRGDKTLSTLKALEGKDVVVTEKLDGECTTLYRDYLHARSVDSTTHPSQSWVRNFHAKISWGIPDSFRVCGENLYARHSIAYDDLETYFYGFSVWDGMTCLSWDETALWFGLLDIASVPVLYKGPFDKQRIVDSWSMHTEQRESEGYVIRPLDSFSYQQFKNVVGKYVRPNHLQTPERWKTEWEKNEIHRG